MSKVTKESNREMLKAVSRFIKIGKTKTALSLRIEEAHVLILFLKTGTLTMQRLIQKPYVAGNDRVQNSHTFLQ